MKANFLHIPTICALSALSTAPAQTETDPKEPAIYSFYVESKSSSKPPSIQSKLIDSITVNSERITKEQWHVFSRSGEGPFNLGEGYSNPLGWTLWKSKGSALFEVTSLTAPVSTDPDHKDDRFTVLYDPAEGKFKKVSLEEYTKWGLKTRLGIADGDNPETSRLKGSAVMMSLRDSFSYFNANQEGFGLDYTNTDGDATWKLKGALMMDFYLDPLYNRTDSWFGDGNPYQFWFRTGVEFDRDDSAAKPFDRTSYYLLTNFQSNPDESARLLGLDSLVNVFSPQFLQFGAALDHDEFTGDNDLRWIVGWQPQFYLTNDFGIFGETLGINRLMYYKQGDFGRFFKPLSSENRSLDEKNSERPSDWYSSFPMDLKLSGGSEILAKAFSDSDSADDALLEWKAGLFVGNAKWRTRLGYFVEGASPAFDPGETHIGQRFVFEMSGPEQNRTAPEQKRTARRSKSGFL